MAVVLQLLIMHGYLSFVYFTTDSMNKGKNSL